MSPGASICGGHGPTSHMGPPRRPEPQQPTAGQHKVPWGRLGRGSPRGGGYEPLGGRRGQHTFRGQRWPLKTAPRSGGGRPPSLSVPGSGKCWPGTPGAPTSAAGHVCAASLGPATLLQELTRAGVRRPLCERRPPASRPRPGTCRCQSPEPPAWPAQLPPADKNPAAAEAPEPRACFRTAPVPARPGDRGVEGTAPGGPHESLAGPWGRRGPRQPQRGRRGRHFRGRGPAWGPGRWERAPGSAGTGTAGRARGTLGTRASARPPDGPGTADFWFLGSRGWGAGRGNFIILWVRGEKGEEVRSSARPPRRPCQSRASFRLVFTAVKLLIAHPGFARGVGQRGSLTGLSHKGDFRLSGSGRASQRRPPPPGSLRALLPGRPPACRRGVASLWSRIPRWAGSGHTLG